MTDAEAVKTVAPQVPDEGLGLNRGARPHEAAKALSERRKRVAGAVAPPKLVAPNDTTEPTQEMARDGAESQGEGQEAPQAQTEGEDIAEPAGGEDPDEAGSGDFPTTFSGLAEALGADPDDLANGLTITKKVNGQDYEISVAEALEGYQRRQDYSRNQDELANARREFETERERTLERAKQQTTMAENWLGVVHGAIQAGPTDAQLSELATSDPDRYVQEKARRDNLVNAYNQVAYSRQQAIEKANQEAETSKAKLVEGERQSLVQLSRDKGSGVPDPSDPEKWPVFEGKIRQYLGTVGFADKDIGEFLSPGGWTAQQVKIIADAMYGRTVRQKGAGVGEKVKHLPKVRKPGMPKDRKQSNEAIVAGARKRLAQNNRGRTGDWNAVALLRAQRAAQKGG